MVDKDTMLRFLYCVLYLVPFVLLCLSLMKVNLTKSERGKQFAMPVVGLVYCTLAAALIEKISDLLQRLIDYLAHFIPFIGRIGWTDKLIYVVNTVIIVVFLLLKLLLLPLFKRLLGKSKQIMESTVGICYEYCEEYDKWFLKPRYGQLKFIYKVFYLVAIAASSLLFITAKLNSDLQIFKVPFYPVFGIIILGEVAFWLGGLTKTEFVEDILGEDENSIRIANYGMLRPILRDLFGQRVIYESTDSYSGITPSSFALLSDMEKSESQAIRTIGKYFSDLKSSGKEVDINYVNSSVNMIEGNSVLFYNPFYRDLTDYIVLPLLKNLMRYKKCLIIVGRDSLENDVMEWVGEGICDATSTENLWKTSVLQEEINECDIGIMRFSDIYNLKLIANNSLFFESVGLVILIEPSRILATGQLALNNIVSKCENDEKNSIVYCACDRNCDGLVDALSHTLKTNITQVFAPSSPRNQVTQMFWEADGAYLHHCILPNISRYLGVGTELGSAAIKYQIPNVSWISADKFPVTDMKWIMGQYYKKICTYTDIPQSQDELNEAFKTNSGLWNMGVSKNAFLIVEDEFENVFEMSRGFGTRASEQCFVNVISDRYLVRDYMLDNGKTFSADPKAIPTVVADYARTQRNTVLKLIMMMTEGPIEDELVKKELMLTGVKPIDTYEAFKELIKKHCGVEDVSLKVFFREEIDESTFESKSKKYYTIENDTSIAEYAKHLKNAYFIAEDEKGERYYICSMLYGHIFQSYLPNQFFTLDGKYYEVFSVSEEDGVIVRRAADHLSGRKYYRQNRRINLTNWQADNRMAAVNNVDGIEIANGFCDIDVNTDGYLELESYNDFKSARRHNVSGIPARRYKNKQVLRITLPDSTEKVRYTICLMLNELFRTTYPQSHQFISALIKKPCEDTPVVEGAMHSLSYDWDDEAIYIIEDSEIDLGLIVSVERNLRRYFEIISELLVWHKSKMEEKIPEEPPAPEFELTFAEYSRKESKVKRFFKKIGELSKKISSSIKKLFGSKKEKKPGKKSKKGKKTDNTDDAFEAVPTSSHLIVDESAETTVDLTEPEFTAEVTDEVEPESEPAEVTDEVEPENEPAETTDEVEPENEPAETTDEVEPENEPAVSVVEVESALDICQEDDDESEQDVEFIIEPEYVDQDEKKPSDDDDEDDGIMMNRDTFVPFPEGTSTNFDISGEAEPAEAVEEAEPAEAVEEAEPAEAVEEAEPAEAVEEAEPAEAVEEAEPAVDIADEGKEDTVIKDEKTRYQKTNFLLFGFDEVSPAVAVNDTIDFLSAYGYNKGPLSQARENAEIADDIEKSYDPNKAGVHFCDFCGKELAGGEYDLLKDGRERCNFCTRTAITTGDEFKEVFKKVLRNMEAFYGIKINVAIKVRMTNAKKIAKHFGEKFVATPKMDGRTLGFAQKDKDGYCIYIENSSPALASIATIAHELTHIWQYLNWDRKEIKRKYGKKHTLEIYEGMAKWVEIQYLYYLNEIEYAKRSEIQTRLRDDEYGHGFLLYAEKYPLSYGVTHNSLTPFDSKFPF